MARARNKLTARQAVALSEPGRHSDGGSLYLVIDGEGAAVRRRWLYLFPWNGKRREMGLGGYPVVSLADARKARDEAERLVREGIDPIANRDASRIAQAGKPTFGEIATTLMDAKASEWRNAKHRAQWKMTLETYAASLWSLPVDEIDTQAVLGALQPIWLEKPETALRLRGRIEAVLDAARAHGHIARNEANPARWRGHLDHVLSKPKTLSRGHHAALPFDQMPTFMADLRTREGVGARALEVAILCAARSGEARETQWREIDVDKRVWTVPATRMKASREHRVPLSDRALEILANVRPLTCGEVDALIFPGQRGKPLSDMSLTAVLRRIGRGDLTALGFRSSFRDWCGEETSFPREIAEAALAHVVGDKAEQAYRRGDALEKRRALMSAWAAWCEPSDGSNVVPLTKKRGAK
jgi:integrase